ncbi:tRNA lysidine(34) synthetase TilS [Mycoplasma sp. Z355B]|uniref:tRNA lysidine(34) synthetase TilS n=1 Tax=unclassified Mycoplasma TaxID=2683645 RepID=UPI003AAA4017
MLKNKFLKDSNNKYLIAVSGGSDSMFLLDRFKKYNVVVAHVNYHQRDDSSIETDIVKKYCAKNKIPLFISELNKEDYTGGNFEDWAREKRYEFFKQIYTSQDCNYLLIAHNKDDFFESAMMTRESNRKKDFFGIKKYNNIYGMNVYRPYVNKYWKDYIAHKCIYERIPFHIDSSNLKQEYTRNKIRMTYRNHTLLKSAWVWYFRIKNSKLKVRQIKVDHQYKKWEKSFYSQDLFVKLTLKDELIYKFINANYDHINLTSGKIRSIVDFVQSQNRTATYKLDNNHFIKKEKGHLIVRNNK